MTPRVEKSRETNTSKRQETQPKKEISKPVESLADAVLGTLTSILKVKDLRGAMGALQDAQKLKDEGKAGEARDLTLKIFDRLKNVGTDTNELPSEEVIKRLASRGEYETLADLISEKRKEINVRGQHKQWKQTADRAKFVEDGLREAEKTKIKRLGEAKLGKPSEESLKELPRESAELIQERARGLFEVEAELNKQVEGRLHELVEQLGGDLGKKEEKKLRNEWDVLMDELKLMGRAELSLHDVEQTREKMKELWIEKMRLGDGLVEKVKDRAKEDEKHSPRKVRSGEKMMRSIVEDRAYAMAVVGRTKELAGMMESIEKNLKLGMSFEQACNSLKPSEVRAIQSWLRGLGKKPGEVGYDAVISEISEEIGKDPEGRRVLWRFMESVEQGYEQAQQQVAVEETKRRGYSAEEARRRVQAQEPLMIDPRTGRPALGLEEGASGMSRRGLEFLREATGDAEWVNEWIRAETEEQMLAAQEKQRSLYRAEMMNVNFEAMMEDEGVSEEFKKLLDVESFSKGQVARLKERYRNDPEKRARFQELWLQEMLMAQRLIAYEGVFQGAHYDARITRYNTLMSIMDVSTSIKGYAKFQGQMFNIVDLQSNSYLDEAALEGLVKPFLAQGPDFRLEHMFKTNRENIYVIDKKGIKRKVGDISVYDVVHKLKMRVEAGDERVAMEMPDGISRHYGTMMERHSEDSLRTRNRKVVFNSLMKDLGINFAGVDDFQKDMIYNMYQSYLDEGIYYLWTKKQLHQAIGNASFEKNSFDLCQALPEMLYKTDPFLVMQYFRKYSVGGQLKDAFVFGDSGMRDQVTMSPNDYAQHLLFAERNTLGAPGIRQAFFGNKEGGRINEYVDWMADTMKEAMFHYGYYDKKNKVSMSTRIGGDGEIKSSTRRPDAEIIDILKGKKPPAGLVEAIEWGTKDKPGFAQIVVNPDLVKKLTSSELTAQQKWNLFVGRFGEDYLNMESPGAKRVEHMSKYGLGQHLAWYKNYLAWQLAPVNNTKIIEMFTPLAAVNSAIAPIIGKNHLEFQDWGNEKLGRAELGGGKTKRVKRNEKGQIQYNTDYGMLGEKDSEWPGLADEDIKNNRNYLDPVQYKSVFSASGIAGYEDGLAMKNLAEDMFRAGLLTEKSYTGWYRKDFRGSFVWQRKMGPLYNIWKWITFDVPFDYMGNVWFGIPGFMLKEGLWEPTKKQVEGIWKYFQN